MRPLTPEGLTKLLGVPQRAAASFTVETDRAEDGVRIRDLRLGPLGIPALCLSPEGAEHTPNAILYGHAHGNRYDIGRLEAVAGRPALRDPPLAIEFVRLGATVICPDLAGFGGRQKEGTESALAKAALWRGGSLMGQMASDLLLALEVLQCLARPRHTTSIGISMGGTLAYLTAALSDRIAACAHLCVFSDIAPLIKAGGHDLHGMYMTIPGLLPGHDMSDIAAIAAPRPQFVFTGGQDPLTPDDAYLPAVRRLEHAYSSSPDTLTALRDASAGHHETPESRQALMDWYRRVSSQ
ncbi:putative hydrolase YtaP [Roseibium aquae]|uniref:Hydrolase YtaP n=1 Tax=Roseibium aquae TaxID=1323746 RepID=A0A916WYD1_9HYPH|nr:alpha/beta fold hydrolase [Roseibium aquae]GGB39495.1 putative hydrolase YtaP [Roseibium aquae]